VHERDFAVVALASAAQDGTPFNQAIVRWALQLYLQRPTATTGPLPPIAM